MTQAEIEAITSQALSTIREYAAALADMRSAAVRYRALAERIEADAADQERELERIRAIALGLARGEVLPC